MCIQANGFVVNEAEFGIRFASKLMSVFIPYLC
jgi:hypothetical protein